jgi:hypothetical protein
MKSERWVVELDVDGVWVKNSKWFDTYRQAEEFAIKTGGEWRILRVVFQVWSESKDRA